MAKYFLNRIFRKKGPPIHLIWFVTSRCNLLCDHCFFHSEIKSDRNELSLDEIGRTINKLSPLLSISLNGGEPFIRDDLPEIARMISEKKLSQNLLLYSNGYNVSRVLESVEKIVSYCKGIRISIGVSIDGFQEEHDRYRNANGSFIRALSTLQELKRMSGACKNLNVGANVTLHRGNQSIVKDLRKYIKEKAGVSLGMTIIRGVPKSMELTKIDENICMDVMKEIEAEPIVDHKRKIFQYLVNTRVALGHRMAFDTYVYKRRSYECYAGSLMGIIYDNGDIFPCEMLPRANMGNLRDYDYDLNKIWALTESDNLRKWIKEKNCFCTFECQYTCNTLYNKRNIPAFIINILKDMRIKCGVEG